MRSPSAAAIALALLLSAAANGAVPPRLVLSGDGFSAGGTIARFGRTGRAEAMALVTPALGRPSGVGSYGDCGQGAVIRYARFRGRFELSFVRGRPSGWTADGPMPRSGRGIGVGASVAALRRAYGGLLIEPSEEARGGLGARFQREGGPNGWLSGTRPGSKVIGLFAGTTCLPGI